MLLSNHNVLDIKLASNDKYIFATFWCLTHILWVTVCHRHTLILQNRTLAINSFYGPVLFVSSDGQFL